MSPTDFEPIGESLKRVARKTPADTAYKRGIAFGAHNTDPESAVLAQDDRFEGFVTRDVVTAPRDLREFLHPDAYMEIPTLAGEMSTLEDYNEIEAEGAGYLKLADTGAIDATSVVGTPLTFENGKLRVAAEGEKFYFELTANSAVASSGFPNRNGALRIRARRRDGMVPVTT